MIASTWYVVGSAFAAGALIGGFALALLKKHSPLSARRLIDGVPDAVFVCNATGKVIAANDAAVRISGLTDEAVRARTLVEIFPALADPARIAASEQRRSFDLMLTAANDARHDSRVTFTRLGDACVVAVRDVSDRRRQQQEVLEALTLLESALSSTADGILVISHEGQIVSYNERFLEMWNIGRDILESGDENVVYATMARQVFEPAAAADPRKLIMAESAESFTILELRDGRRIERSSVGRDLGGGTSIRVWSFRDVTARFAAEAALRESEVRYRLLFEQNAAGVCATRGDGTIIDCNTTFAAILGFSRSQLIGHSMRSLYARPIEFDELRAMLHDSPTLSSVEVELHNARGTSIWVLQNLVLVGRGDSEALHATLVDISDRKRAEEQIEFHAYHDVLTHLPNRKLFNDRLQHSVTRARRTGKPLAVLFIDLDDFKDVNDSLGHTAGDEVLLEMAQRLRRCVREDDTVGRLGGDEFTIILSDLRQPEDAIAVAEKLLEAVQLPISLGGIPVRVTASIGIALFPNDGADPESLLRNADSAMYRAKESGRNNFQVCTEEMKRRAVERLSLETRLQKALHEDQLVVMYQPQVSLITGKIVAAESLVRWNDPDRGVIDPADFVPLAEETRLIISIGEWVLRAACRQAAEWQGTSADAIRVAVNVSGRQLQQRDFPQIVRSALQESALAPELLDLEFSETTAMQNIDFVADVFRDPRELGVGVVIDDFGTNYSSLRVLSRLPITAVKIDGGLIGNIENAGDAAIVEAVIRVARGLVLRSVGEGVETIEQLMFLQRHRCDAAQGYFIAGPLRPENIAAAVAERQSLITGAPRLPVRAVP